MKDLHAVILFQVEKKLRNLAGKSIELIEDSMKKNEIDYPSFMFKRKMILDLLGKSSREIKELIEKIDKL